MTFCFFWGFLAQSLAYSGAQPTILSLTHPLLPPLSHPTVFEALGMQL